MLLRKLDLHCFEFLLKAAEEIEKRLLENKDIFKALLSISISSPVSSRQGFICAAASTPTNVGQRFCNSGWMPTGMPSCLSRGGDVKSTNVPKNSADFWISLNSCEEAKCITLSPYCNSGLLIPASNALAGRVLAQVSIVKNKQRYRRS